MKKIRPVQLWVDPEFKKEIKVYAAREGLSIMEASNKISKKIKVPEEEPVEIQKLSRPRYRI